MEIRESCAPPASLDSDPSHFETNHLNTGRMCGIDGLFNVFDYGFGLFLDIKTRQIQIAALRGISILHINHNQGRLFWCKGRLLQVQLLSVFQCRVFSVKPAVTTDSLMRFSPELVLHPQSQYGHGISSEAGFSDQLYTP